MAAVDADAAVTPVSPSVHCRCVPLFGFLVGHFENSFDNSFLTQILF